MRRIRVVLDTNVVVSAHLNGEGYERHVLDLGLAGKLQMAVSEPILTEYDGVLRRARFGIKPRQVSQSIRLIRKAARIVSPDRELTDPRSGGQSFPEVHRGVEGRLSGDGKPTPFSHGMAADPGRERPGIAGMDHPRTAAMSIPHLSRQPKDGSSTASLWDASLWELRLAWLADHASHSLCSPFASSCGQRSRPQRTLKTAANVASEDPFPTRKNSLYPSRDLPHLNLDNDPLRSYHVG
jgi:hypothetical protein